jgi:hypothetical protein
VSTQFGSTVKAIQCNNRREFDNSSTHFFLLLNNTQFWMSCPYTSPQNGKVERIIHSVNNIIHTLLIQASLPRCYWAEGLHRTTYLLNCLPTTTIQAVCPHLALFGSAPSYEHMRVFGCTCYPNTTATAPHKLSPRSTRCALSSLSRSSFIQCTSMKHDFCHACQLGRHTRLPFCSLSYRAKHPFDLIHLDLWTSPVVSVSGSKYYLVIF